MGQLHVEAEHTTQAAPETVWELSATSHATPVGAMARGRLPAARERLAARARRGSVAALLPPLRLRCPTSVEKILEAEPGRRLVYTVIGGIPVRNYRAEVTRRPSLAVPGSDGPPPGTRPWRAAWCNARCERCTRRSSPTWREPRRSRLRWCPASRPRRRARSCRRHARLPVSGVPQPPPRAGARG